MRLAARLLVLVFLAACGQAVLPTDAGQPLEDAGGAPDAGLVPDAGASTDAGPSSADAGAGDSGIVTDAGTEDGGLPNDLCSRPSFGSGFAITQVSSRRANQGRFSVPPFQVKSVFPRSPTRLDVFFSRATEQPTVTDFSLSPMVGVVGVSDGGTTLVTISTGPQVPGRAYVLNVSGVKAASDLRVFPTAQLAFTGYQSSFKAIASGPSARAREVALIFSEPVACAALVPSSFSIPGRQILAVSFFGACSSSTQSARLQLDRTLPPGQHVVTASPAVVTLAGQPLELHTATTQGPSTTSARSVFGVSTDQPTSITVTFDEPVGTEALDAGVYAFTPPLAVLAVAPITNTTNVRLTTHPLTANTVYTLMVAGPAGALPPARFWGHDSFFVSQAFSARLHLLLGLLVEAQLDAYPGEFSRGVDLHLLELPRIHEAGVGIVEGAEHPPDRLIAFLGAAVALGQQVAAQLAPLIGGVFAGGVEVVAEDDLPGLIHHLLGTVGDQRGGARGTQPVRADDHGGGAGSQSGENGDAGATPAHWLIPWSKTVHTS